MAAPPSLLGREGETAVIAAALDDALAGRSAILVIEGEAGIGKSRLLGAAFEDARRRAFHVAAGRAEELEQSRPFGLMASALGCDSSASDVRRAEITAMLAAPHHGEREPITVSSDPGLQFRVVDAMVDLVEELSGAQPLVVGLDDLQWADPPSLLTVAALSRRLAYLPVVLVACLRPVPRNQELTRLLSLLLDTPRVRHMSVRGLDPDDVTKLVAASIARAPGPQLLAAVARAAAIRCTSVSCSAPFTRKGRSRSSTGGASCPARRSHRR